MGTDLFSVENKSVPIFLQRLISWNGLLEAGFMAWEFLPGMRFAERAAWWRGGADRGSAHEGLDIRFYRTGDGRQLSLGAGAHVPAIWAGEVVSVADDFLGRSVFVAHDTTDGAGRRLHSVYGHVCPHPGLESGSILGDGDAVGTIADTSGKNSAVPPHLHITLALIDRDCGPARLDWVTLRDRSRVELLDPLPILGGG